MKGLAFILIMLGISPAYGQTAAQVTDALASIRAHDKLLGTASDNMQGMTIGQERDVLASANDTINLMRAFDGAVIAVANLVRHMRDPEDLRQVQLQLQSTLAIALRVADVYVNAMNGYLALLKGPAPAAEVTKARDEMIAIRAALQSLQVDAGASANH